MSRQLMSMGHAADEHDMENDDTIEVSLAGVELTVEHRLCGVE